MRTIGVLSVLALLCGCPAGGDKGAATPEPGTTPAGADDEQPEAEARPIPEGTAPEKLVVLFEYLATDVRTAGTDCDAQARAFLRWTTAYAEDYDRLVEDAVGSDLPAERVETLNRRLAEHMDAIIDTFDTNCDDHDQARAAFDEFEGLVLGS